jgi:hypothetical protein
MEANLKVKDQEKLIAAGALKLTEVNVKVHEQEERIAAGLKQIAPPADHANAATKTKQVRR